MAFLGYLYVADVTPMQIVGEYGSRIVSGAGCVGVEAQGSMFFNGGVSARFRERATNTIIVQEFTSLSIYSFHLIHTSA